MRIWQDVMLVQQAAVQALQALGGLRSTAEVECLQAQLEVSGL